jgi:hypothetical protein
MNEILSPFCTYNTGTVITPNTDMDVYLVSALASFSGAFGTVTVGANQSFNPFVPLKIETPVSGSAMSLFYYFG